MNNVCDVCYGKRINYITTFDICLTCNHIYNKLYQSRNDTEQSNNMLRNALRIISNEYVSNTENDKVKVFVIKYTYDESYLENYHNLKCHTLPYKLINYNYNLLESMKFFDIVLISDEYLLKHVKNFINEEGRIYLVSLNISIFDNLEKCIGLIENKESDYKKNIFSNVSMYIFCTLEELQIVKINNLGENYKLILCK